MAADPEFFASRLKLKDLELIKLKRAHKNFRATVHDQLLVLEHYWEHQMPTCKTCDGARRVLRELILATRSY